MCASDAGWINGHTYSIFGPLFIGCTTILMEKPISILNKTVLLNLLKLKPDVIFFVTLIRLMREIYKNLKIKKILKRLVLWANH